jgi:tetratricopeptide (TPR) repeat protein
MKKLILYLLMGLLHTGLVSADQIHQEFQKGNNFFQKGDYVKAAQTYENILKHGEEAAELYFNLGNAYFKSGNIPASILNYERAKRLDPSDEDIDFNLKLVNLRITDKIEALPEIFFKRWWIELSGLLSTDAWAQASLILFFMSLAFLIVYSISASIGLKKLFFFCGILFIFAGAGSYFLGKQSLQLNYGNEEAILFSQSTYIKSSPDEKSIDAFILHEGTKVRVLDSLGEWKKIRIDNGNQGWVKSAEITEI